jgi:hypothetical protein
MDHVTAVFVVPVTEVLKVADWPFVIEIQFGNTEIAIAGSSVIVAVRIVPLKSEAVTVTVLVPETVVGALYRPVVVPIKPEVLGLINQMNCSDPALFTVNCWLCDGLSVTAPGVTNCACATTAAKSANAAGIISRDIVRMVG